MTNRKKKGYDHIREKISIPELVNVVQSEQQVYPIQKLCKVLGLQRSSYYFCTSYKVKGKWQCENERLEKEIIRVYEEQKGVYGAPKIREVLKQANVLPFLFSLKRVQRLMRRLGLRSIVVKKYRPTKPDKAVYEGGVNLLKRDFNVTSRNEKWVSDITYVYVLKDGWCYLASILDLATNKIVGWNFSKTMDKACVLKALDHAVATQKPEKGCILHSDRGSQYTSHEYRRTLAEKGFKQSFSAKGCPYDNAPIESFHAILKRECVYLTQFHTYEEAKVRLFEFIEGRYNRNRIHSGIAYKTPQQMEDLLPIRAAV